MALKLWKSFWMRDDDGDDYLESEQIGKKHDEMR